MSSNVSQTYPHFVRVVLTPVAWCYLMLPSVLQIPFLSLFAFLPHTLLWILLPSILWIRLIAQVVLYIVEGIALEKAFRPRLLVYYMALLNGHGIGAIGTGTISASLALLQLLYSKLKWDDFIFPCGCFCVGTLMLVGGLADRSLELIFSRTTGEPLHQMRSRRRQVPPQAKQRSSSPCPEFHECPDDLPYEPNTTSTEDVD